MILDEFGQPIRKPMGFISPDWIREQMTKILRADVDAYSQMLIDQKVDDLYESAEVERPGSRVIGNVVTVGLPKKFQAMK